MKTQCGRMSVRTTGTNAAMGTHMRQKHHPLFWEGFSQTLGSGTSSHSTTRTCRREGCPEKEKGLPQSIHINYL